MGRAAWRALIVLAITALIVSGTLPEWAVEPFILVLLGFGVAFVIARWRTNRRVVTAGVRHRRAVAAMGGGFARSVRISLSPAT